MPLVDSIADALDRLVDAPDPLAEVAAVRDLQLAVSATRDAVVRAAITTTSYADVARVLGISRQAVRVAYGGATRS